MLWPFLRRASQDFNTLTLRKCSLMPHCVLLRRKLFLRRKGKAPSHQQPSQVRNRCTFPLSYILGHTPGPSNVTISCHAFGGGGREGLEVRRQVDSRSQIVLVWAQREVLQYFFLPMCTWAHSWFICDFISSRIKWEHNDCLTGLLKRMNKWLGQNENEMNICEKMIV